VARAHRRRRKLPQPEADNSEISGLIAASAALEERVGNMVDEFQREREGAAQHRRDLRLVIEALSASVRGLTATVSEIKPLVDDWRETRASFEVDNVRVFESHVSPHPPLGLVVWIDNQYAAFTPEGKIGFGVLQNPEPAWLEIRELELR